MLIYCALGALAYLTTDFAPNYQRFSLAVSVSATLLHLTALPFYLRGFKYFKHELRIAYTQISVGLAFLGLATLQLSIVNLFGWEQWISSGGVLLPYLVALTQILWGTGRFARSVGVTTKLLSFWRVVGVAVLFGTLAAALPHAETVLADRTIRAGVWMTTVLVVFFSVSAYALQLASKKVGKSYVASLLWLRTGFIAAVLASVVYIGNLLFTGADDWFAQWNITIVFLNFSGFLFMTSGYAFSIIGAPAAAKANATKATSIDIILYTEGLATNHDAIDDIVDDLRMVTSHMHSSTATITPEDQLTLLETYRKLENYLTTQDPLRKLTVDEVRSGVERSLSVTPESHDTFWPQVRATA